MRSGIRELSVHGHNADFVRDWTKYLDKVLIDNVSWFRNIKNAGKVGLVNLAKAGRFDFMPTGSLPPRVQFRLAPEDAKTDPAVGGYWCPFEAGGGLPGWIDLPLLNPTHKYMFTPAMQGCALVATKSPRSGHIRVFHHQHPDGAGGSGVWNAIRAQGQAPVSILGFEDYGTVGLNGNAPNAFNFLFYRNSNWNYVTQAHTLVNTVNADGPTLQVNRRAMHGTNGVSISSLT